MEAAQYCNFGGATKSSPSCMSNGNRLPDARKISNWLEEKKKNIDAKNKKRTKLLTDIGQYITHDIIQVCSKLKPWSKLTSCMN